MYKSLQGCRAAAALLVVLLHLGAALGSAKYFAAPLFAVPFIAGDSGVDFFFVLSGFIIVWVHFGDIGRPAGLWNYLRKRAARIYPTYWMIFALVFLAALVSPGLQSAVPHDLSTLLKSLALIPQDPLVSGGSGAPVLTVAWSLQYEICFYALVAVFIASRRWGILVSIPLVLNFMACHGGGCTFPRSFLSNNLVLLFSLGALVAFLCKRSYRIRHPNVVALAAALAFVAYGAYEAVVGIYTVPVDRRLVYGLLSGVLILALVQAEDSGQLVIKRKWLSVLGDSSYCLYLIHYPLLSASCKVLIHLGFAGSYGAAAAFPLILVECILVSVGLHLWVEKPILRALSPRTHEQRTGLELARGLP